jgi:preprotein translocase subunit YajC
MIALLIAATTLTTQPDPKPGWLDTVQSPFLLMGAVILISFMFMGKGKRQDEKKRADMLKQLKRGDRIQTIGGIQGAVTRAEENRVEVKVDETSNTKIWFARSAIARVIDEEKSETK